VPGDRPARALRLALAAQDLGYHQRKRNGASLPLLMIAYGHSSEAQTLRYLFIQERELRDPFLGMDL
jgi:hypothetical protein